MRLNILSQVTIDPDESSEAFLVFSGTHIKHEEQGEEAIYISSDDEEVTRPHCVVVNPRLMNTSDFPQPPEAIATLVQRLRPNLTPAIASRSFPPPVPLQPRLFTEPPPNLSTLPSTPVVSLSHLPSSLDHRALVLPSSAPVGVSTASYLAGITFDARQRNVTQISPWQVVSTGPGGTWVVCPVCRSFIKNRLGEHMKGHKHEMSRPCQMCIDHGNLFTMVAPEWLFRHIQSAHQMIGPPPQHPLIGASVPAAPLPVQPAERSPAPASGVWEFVGRNGEQWVVCPFCTGKGYTTMKAKNLNKHLSKHHPLNCGNSLV